MEFMNILEIESQLSGITDEKTSSDIVKKMKRMHYVKRGGSIVPYATALLPLVREGAASVIESGKRMDHTEIESQLGKIAKSELPECFVETGVVNHKMTYKRVPLTRQQKDAKRLALFASLYPIVHVAERDDNGQTTGNIVKQSVGFQEYPALDAISPNWRITKVNLSDFGVKYETTENGKPETKWTSGMFYIYGTLLDHSFMWVKDDAVVFVDAMDFDGVKYTFKRFMEAMNIVVNMKSGPFKTSKRLSRYIGNIYKAAHHFSIDASQIRIVYNNALNEKAWDGIGRITRKFLNQLIASNLRPSVVPEVVWEAMVQQLQNGERFEFTIMSEEGQDKGHIVVTEDTHVIIDGVYMEYDVMFGPNAPKVEVRKHGEVFIGLKPIVGHSTMDLDVQSLINLHAFLGVDNLLSQLDAEGKRVLEDIRSGEMQRILDRSMSWDKATNLENVQGWVLAEYATSGGHPHWFASTTKKAGMQHITKLEHRLDITKMRFPINGGRWYIITDDAMGMKVKSGEAVIRHGAGSIVVNADDYVSYIMGVLGGCDGDDGTWVVPFTDTDGVKKFIIWRSPNAQGEYILLNATERGYQFDEFPQMDSALLPVRIDKQNRTLTPLPKGEKREIPTEYRFESFLSAILTAVRNQGILGKFVNVLMDNAAHNIEVDCPIALEEVVDGAVKDGNDLTPASDWADKDTYNRYVVNQQKPCRWTWNRVNRSLDKEEVVLIENRGFTTDLWLDVLMAGAKAHIELFEKELEQLAMEAMPPIELFKRGHMYMADGEKLFSEYGKHMKAAKQENGSIDWQYVHDSIENTLKAFGNRQYAMLGAAVYCYAMAAGTNKKPSDGILFMSNGIGLTFIQALRNIGMLGYKSIESSEDGWGRIKVTKPEVMAVPRILKVKDTWYEFTDKKVELSKCSKEVREAAKEKVKANIGNLAGKVFTVGSAVIANVERLTMLTSNARSIGPLAHGTMINVGETISVVMAYESRGDVVLVTA